MALITCKDCNNRFSTDVSRCPSCGSRKPGNLGRKLVITFLVIFMLGFCEAVKNPPPQQTQKPPLDYSKPIYTEDYAIVCPESLFFDRQAETPQKIMSLFTSIWGKSEKAKELGCEIWQGGIHVYAQKLDIGDFIAVGTSLPTTLFTMESELKNVDAPIIPPATNSQLTAEDGGLSKFKTPSYDQVKINNSHNDDMKLGDCTNTTIKEITTRLENAPDSGTAITYANGIYGVSYETVPEIANSNIGDPARVCLIEVPHNCPPGDNRGKVYSGTNLKTNAQWSLPDSEHNCGGA